MHRQTQEVQQERKRLENSRRITYGKIPHSGIFGTIFPFYYYIFMRQTRNTGRCPILALTSSFSLYAFNIFDCFQYEQVVPHCLYCRYCALQYLIWSGSNTVCLRAADPPASLRGSHRLTGFSTLPFERDRTPLRWISRTSAGEEVPCPRTNKGQGSGPSEVFASLRGPSSDSLWGTFQRGCRVIAAAEGHAALCRPG